MAGYQPSVYAFNHALRALHNIDVPLRKSTELTLLFHRNDPKPITATHSGHLSTRKPDIILVFLDVAQNAFSEGDPGTWADHALKTAAEPPNNDFEWSDTLSAGELRRTMFTLPSPPAKYTVKPANEIPLQPKDLLAQEGLTQPSKETMPNPLNTVQVSCEPLLIIILTVH
jgi:hypothetical protein